jgi:hypothetical protein
MTKEHIKQVYYTKKMNVYMLEIGSKKGDNVLFQGFRQRFSTNFNGKLVKI